MTPSTTNPRFFYGTFRDYTRTAQGRTVWTPEHRLMAAVLIQAAEDLSLPNTRPGRARRYQSGRSVVEQATLWFESRDDRTFFSFEHICASLNLDATAVRTRLLRRLWRGAHRHAHFRQNSAPEHFHLKLEPPR